MSYQTPISDADLHAYLDNQLSESRRLQVELWLKDHPDKLRELKEYQAIDQELQGLYEPVLNEPVPARLRIPPGKRFYSRVAAAAGFIFIGMMIGWQGNRLMLAGNDGQQLQNHLLQPATFAHVIYTREKKHPVEVSGEQEQHLINWLSKRLHAQIKAPTLSQHGYQLVGGRLLPSTNRMAAQFMYQNATGTRVTLYVRRIAGTKADAMFQFSRDKNVNAFYWIEGELGYALSGELEKQQLMAMAKTSFHQLNQGM